MAWCVDNFTVEVLGGDVPCEMEISSAFDSPTYSIGSGSNDLATAQTVTVDFVYEVGAPERTVFASGYTKRRSGASGTPPDLGARSFSPAVPDTTKPPNEQQDGRFTVVVPARDTSAISELGTGQDLYTIQVFIKEAADELPGENLEPANPT